jgi:hypothetical protein
MALSPALLIILACTSVLIQMTVANVEKVIFLAPQLDSMPSKQVSFDDLGIDRLSPSSPVVRTYLDSSFPTDGAPLGSESWFYLENLIPGRRYEVRICWLATVRFTTISGCKKTAEPRIQQCISNGNEYQSIADH